MTAILAYNDPSALGAIAAKGGDFQPLVTGMNGDADGLAAVKYGRDVRDGRGPERRGRRVDGPGRQRHPDEEAVSEDRLVPRSR